jgi:hypothetical protein
MGFWDKSLQIFKCLCNHGRQGVRRMAQQTGLSKSSVHRLTQAMERRNAYPESWLWETAEGRQWLTHLVVAAVYTFGLKRGGDGNAERVFRSCAPRGLTGLFAFGLTWCDTSIGASAAQNCGGLGAGRARGW